MARSDRFYIGQIQGSGLENDLKPFAIPDEAFARLNNAYVWRGRVRKRFGARLMPLGTTFPAGYESLHSRLRILVGTTDASGDASGTVTGAIFEEGQMFSIGDQVYTANALGTPANLLNTGAGTATYNTTTGAYVFTGATALTDVYFYPATPVMGIINYEDEAVNDEPAYVFDTQFAYEYTTSGWDRLGDAVWLGGNSDFFWGTNWQGILSSETYLFVTNFTSTDGIKYYNGANWTQNTATPAVQIPYRPVLNNTNRLLTARILLPFKDRLIALNTIENNEGSILAGAGGSSTAATTGNYSGVTGVTGTLGGNFVVNNVVFTIASTTAGAQPMTVRTIGLQNPPTATYDISTNTLVITGNNHNPNTDIYYLPNTGGTEIKFPNRCRFTWNGSPISANDSAGNPVEPNSTQSWLEAPGLGGYIDAPTKEAIITAQFLYDRLIVYFERSTWELVYTGNQILPFVWQKINTELGAESTFSQVPFDKHVLGVGNVGIHACDGSNVSRIDKKIPDAVFEVHNTDNALQRVAGIRDYFPEIVYWTFPDTTRNANFPFNNKVLVYNYKTGSWAFNDDSITAFGYFQSSTGTSATWASIAKTWAESDFTWRALPRQEKFRSIIAGNQQGYMFIVDVTVDTNSPALQITDMSTVGSITCYNHNLSVGDYIKIESAQGITTYNTKIYQVDSVADKDTFSIDTVSTGTYTGAGVITRVSQIDILTKQYNFYVKQGRNVSINKIDFLMDRTESGQFAIDYYAGTSNRSLVTAGTVTGALLGSGTLETSPYTTFNAYEDDQAQLWHSFYPIVNGEYIQMRFYLNDAQMTDVSIVQSAFVLHAMQINATATGFRLQ